MMENDTLSSKKPEQLSVEEKNVGQLNIDYQGLLGDSLEWNQAELATFIQSLGIRSNVRIVSSNTAQPEAAEHPNQGKSSFVYITSDLELLAEIVLNDGIISDQLLTFDKERFVTKLNEEVNKRLIELSGRENSLRFAHNLEMFLLSCAILFHTGVAVLAGAGIYLSSDEALGALQQMTEENVKLIDDEAKLYLILFVASIGFAVLASSNIVKYSKYMSKRSQSMTSDYRGVVSKQDITNPSQLLRSGCNLFRSALAAPQTFVTLQQQDSQIEE